MTIEPPLGNGQEVHPDVLRALANHLLTIAGDVDARDMDRGYLAAKGKVDY